MARKPNAKLKLECMRIAQRILPQSGPDRVFECAGRILEWVTSADAVPRKEPTERLGSRPPGRPLGPSLDNQLVRAIAAGLRARQGARQGATDDREGPPPSV